MMAPSTERQKTTRRRDIGEARVRVRQSANNWKFIAQQGRKYLGRGGTDPAFAFIPELCAVIDTKTANVFDDTVKIDVHGPYRLWTGLLRFLDEQAHAFGLCRSLTVGLSQAREKIERTWEGNSESGSSSDAEAGFGGEVGD